jgi:hypothetical protein
LVFPRVQAPIRAAQAVLIRAWMLVSVLIRVVPAVLIRV